MRDRAHVLAAFGRWGVFMQPSLGLILHICVLSFNTKQKQSSNVAQSLISVHNQDFQVDIRLYANKRCVRVRPRTIRKQIPLCARCALSLSLSLSLSVPHPRGELVESENEGKGREAEEMEVVGGGRPRD